MARRHDFITAVDKQVGRKIHDFRIALGISRDMLAKKVGISHQQLAKYEHGSNRLSIGRLIMIADELGEPVTAFISNLELKDKTKLPKERLTIELVRSFTAIENTKIKEAINNLAKVVSKWVRWGYCF